MRARVPQSEFRDRLDVVREQISASGVDAGLWFDPISVEYLTGYHHLQTERPIALAIAEDTIEITIPKIERPRAEAIAWIEDVHHYFDYPSGNPITAITEMLDGMDVELVAADREGTPTMGGRDTEGIFRRVDVEPQEWVDYMRWWKSDAEIELIRESAKWGDLAHRYLVSFMGEPQAHPITAGLGAATEASRVMMNQHGQQYAARTRVNGPVLTGFISEHETAIPHGYSSNRRLAEGDILITYGGATVDSYHSEVQRTMFVGEPADEHVHYYEAVTLAQEIALDSLKPGVTVSYVDQQVYDFFEEQGYSHLVYHNVGHGIGLCRDEWPYLDRGSEITIEPGHVYVIKPGIYTEEYGYRHADTVLVTEDGNEQLTSFPRDLESNTIRLGQTGVNHDHH